MRRAACTRRSLRLRRPAARVARGAVGRRGLHDRLHDDGAPRRPGPARRHPHRGFIRLKAPWIAAINVVMSPNGEVRRTRRGALELAGVQRVLQSRAFKLAGVALIVVNVLVFGWSLLARRDPVHHAFWDGWWINLQLLLPTLACVARAVLGGPDGRALPGWPPRRCRSPSAASSSWGGRSFRRTLRSPRPRTSAISPSTRA
jgi:hypothetical protein